MSKKRKSSNAAVPLVLLAVAGGIAVVSYLGHRDSPPRTSPPSVRVAEPPPPAEPPRTEAEDARPPKAKPLPPDGVIYTVSAKGGDVNDLAPKPAHLARSRSPARDALKELLRADGGPLPSGTSLRGLKIADGLATVDFTQEFQTNFHGSDTQEAQTVNSILRTLGQFPQIERVQILVEGKPIEALSQLPIAEPLPVLRPGTSVAGRADASDGGG